MNIRQTIITITTLLLLPVGSVWAQEGTTWFGDTADGQWLAGIKYGQMTNDDPGFENADAWTLVLGYQFARTVGVDGSSSVELEFSDTLEASRNTGIAGDNWDARAYGLYLSYRTPGTIYFKGRVGILWSDIRTESNNIKLTSESEADVALGVGLGILLGATQNINLEIDYTQSGGDHDISLFNVGGSYRF